MRTLFFTIIIIIGIASNLQAQTDTTNVGTLKQDDLLSELSNADSNAAPLLPSHIMITQRMLWGKKGLMRNFDAFELTPEKRQHELKIRRTMLVTHQVVGFATLAGMIAQGIVGTKLYNGDYQLKEAHEALGIYVNIGFFTTAGLSLFAPPKMINERKGYSSVKLHRALGVLSITAMVATNVLARNIDNNPDLKPYHRAAAFTAFGSFALQIITIKF
jgi:hypothetical protein